MKAEIPKADFEITTGRGGSLADYLAIARFDHSTKHVFIVPGIVLACLLRGVHTPSLARSIVCGLMAAICIASANYVINEWLDRDFDRHHPTKFKRSAVQKELAGGLVWLEWSLFVGAGLGFAILGGKTMMLAGGMFALQGLLYNVPPIRMKNTAYLDVISESINNPLRLILGWAMIDSTTLPPASIILAYWLGGAFLMAAKRLSEYREIVASHSKGFLTRYRASFGGYTETSLIISCFVYTLLSSFFLAIFLIRYRIEYIIVLPAITILFAHYLAISMKPGSSAQKPETLFRERGLISVVVVMTLLFGIATAVDIPALGPLTRQRYIVLQ